MTNWSASCPPSIWPKPKLAQTGNVLLSGDLAHFRENYETSGVPIFNVNRAETLASIDRVKKLTANLKATVIIQHDPRDLGKLPAFSGCGEVEQH